MTVHPITGAAELAPTHQAHCFEHAPTSQSTHDAAPAAYPGAFKPLSREDVAALLGISLRTLGNWRNEGLLPEAVTIGSRCYWHPERFFNFLNARLLADSSGAEQPSVTAQPKLARQPKVEPSSVGQRAVAASQSQTASMLDAARRKAAGVSNGQVA